MDCLSYRSLLSLSLAIVACSCGPSNDTETISMRFNASQAQTLAGPAGSVLRVPANSLDVDTTITVSALGTRRAPQNAAVVSTPIRFGPEGQTFAHGVELELQIDVDSIPNPKTIDDVVVLRAPQGSTVYVPLPTRRASAASVVAITEHFSDFIAVVITGAGVVPAGCGDQACTAGESCTSCPSDCGLCLAAGECGNAICEAIETCTACEFDCVCVAPMDGGVDAATPIVCAGASAPTNGTVSASSATFPDSITYDCDPGFSVVGSLSSTCQANGMFDTAPPTCVVSTTTVYFASSGLEWQQTVDAADYDWPGANAYCNGLQLGGRDDWRMPTRMELVGIVDYSVNDPSINGVTFPGTPNVSFHTSTDGTVVMTGGVWYVGFWTGFTGVQSSTTLARVRCVRTVVPMTGTFVDQADGTVADTLTGLVWQQADSTATYTQSAAADYCGALDLGGEVIGTWRLPTVVELQGLVDTTRSNPAIDPVLFPSSSASYHWTSSVNPTDSTAHWGVLFTSGGISYVFDSGALDVRCVH